MTKHYISIFIALSTTFLFGCNAINPKETVPTFLQIDSVQVLPTQIEKHGSVSHKITDVWVYYNFDLLGAFEIPAKIPILANGSGNIQIVPGIWDNGLSGTRAKYPFYNVDTFTLVANPGQSVHHTPKISYRTDAVANVDYFAEGFEQGNSFVKLSGDSTLMKTNIPAEVFEGDWSGKIFLHDSIKNIETITNQSFLLPRNKESYLELNYKSDIQFTVNLKVAYNGEIINSQIIGLKAKENWTKVYLKLSGFASTYQNGQFQFYFSTSLPSNQATATVLVDNFKVIHFN